MSVFTTLVLLVGTVDAQENEVRNWRTAKGGHTVKAKLVEVNGDSVVLLKEDGNQVTVKLDLLVLDDQKYALAASSGNGTGNSSTFQRPPATNKGPMIYDRVRILEVDREVEWAPINASSAPHKPVGQPVVFKIDGEVGMGPSSTGMIADPSGSKLMFLTGGFRKGAGWVLDLETGKPLVNNFPLPAGCKPKALSSDMKSLVVLPGVGGRGNAAWLTATSRGIREQLTWRYSTATFAELKFAKFIDENLLVTSDTMGAVSLWDLNARKLLWQVVTTRDCVPAISHDNKTLVTCNEEYLMQLALPSGEVKGAIKSPMPGVSHFKFSPTGKDLLCLGRQSMREFDISNGKTREHWTLTSGDTIVGWASEDQILTKHGRGGSLHLVDLNLKCEARYYMVRTVGGSIALDSQGRVWSVLRDVQVDRENSTSEIKYTVECNTLPQPHVADWIAARNFEDLAIVKPGDSIRLDLYAVVHNATSRDLDDLYAASDRAEDRADSNSQRSGSGSRTRGGAGPGGLRSADSKRKRKQNPKGYSDYLEEEMRGINLPAVDVSEDANRIVMEKLAANGLKVSKNAEYTLVVEIGHPTNLTNLRKDMTKEQLKDIPRSNVYPHSVGFQAFLKDASGKILWKTGSNSRSALLKSNSGENRIRSTTGAIRTTGPESVEYLELLDLPGTITRFSERGITTIHPGKITEQDFDFNKK